MKRRLKDDKMERRIFMLTTLPLIIFLTTVQADKCGNRCTSTEICADGGKCYEQSDLIKCFSYTSLFKYHYCPKTQDCCDDGCMPKGSVCCNFWSRFCERGHSCCSFIGCCAPGTFCRGSECIDDRFSTKRHTKATPPSTAKPITRDPPRTTKWFENRTHRSSTNDSKSELKLWVYAVIVIVVIVVISVVVAVALLIRRRRNITSNAPSGRRGIVLSTPTRMYGQAISSNGTISGVQIQTNKPPEQLYVNYDATKPVVPALAMDNANTNKKIGTHL